MLILRGGRVIDPRSERDEVADVVIEGGRIRSVGKGAGAGLEGERVETIDCAGRWVVPGLIDLHVHLREPGQEYKEDIESGLAAAAAGGFTTVCAMPNTKPVNDTRAITEAMMRRARDVTGARLRVFGAVTKGSHGEELTEMADLKEGGALGVSDDGVCVMNAAVMRRALEYARTFDLLVSQHCEDHHMTAGATMNEGPVATRLGLRGWPREAEDVIVARDIILAEMTGARYHVAHISSRGAVRLVREAKARGLPVTAEVTPHHLLLTDEAVVGYRTFCKVNPPLRSEEDREAVREGLRDGTIDCIATDHAPHSTLEKDCELDVAAFGILGLEPALPTLLALVRDGALSETRLVEALTAAPGAGGQARGRRAPGGRRAPTSRSSIPSVAWTLRDGEPEEQVAQHAVPRSGGRRRRHPHTRRWRGGLPEGGMIERDAHLVLADGTAFEGTAIGAARHHRRRGGLHDRYDRLPGGPHRPLVLPPGRLHDGAADGQHGDHERGSRRPRQPHLAGFVVHELSSIASNWRSDRTPRPVPEGQRRRRHRERRHARADAPHPRPRRADVRRRDRAASRRCSRRRRGRRR